MTDERPNNHAPALQTERPSQGLVDQAKAASYSFMNPERWNMMNLIAKTFSEAGALPASIKNAPQCLMVIQAGFEAGLQPIEALNSFYFVNGKLSMYGENAIGLVIKSGHDVSWGECNDRTATCTIKRGDNGKTMSSTFTIEQAKARGIVKNAWLTWPENMLKFKAFWSVARFLVPDALHGVPAKEELEEVIDEKGEVLPRGKGKHGIIVHEARPEITKTDEESLTDTLNTPEEKPVEKPEKKTVKKKEGTEQDAEPVKKEIPKEESANAKKMRLSKDKGRYDTLVENELNGAMLTDEEKTFLRNYEAQARQ